MLESDDKNKTLLVYSNKNEVSLAISFPFSSGIPIAELTVPRALCVYCRVLNSSKRRESP